MADNEMCTTSSGPLQSCDNLQESIDTRARPRRAFKIKTNDAEDETYFLEECVKNPAVIKTVALRLQKSMRPTEEHKNTKAIPSRLRLAENLELCVHLTAVLTTYQKFKIDELACWNEFTQRCSDYARRDEYSDVTVAIVCACLASKMVYDECVKLSDLGKFFNEPRYETIHVLEERLFEHLWNNGSFALWIRGHTRRSGFDFTREVSRSLRRHVV